MSVSDHDPNTAYFLGVEGEQTGPYTEKDLAQKISQGVVSPEALVWWEGQTDWERISDIPRFKSFFGSTRKSTITPPTKPSSPPNLDDYTVGGSHPHLDWIATFARPGKESMPVYDSKEGYFNTEKAIPIKTAIAALVLCVIGFGVWIVLKFTTPEKPKTAKKQVSSKEQSLLKRRQVLTQATSQLLLNPAASIAQLNDLISKNAKDPEGKEAAEVLLNYYRQNKQVESAAQLLVKLERYGEAAQLFGTDNRFASQTEVALFKAFQNSSGKESADFLTEDIRLLIKPLEQLSLARERIALFEKQFPNFSHPFTYYQLPVDQQITSIFTRLSSSLVGLLNSHISEEFPSITLASRPLVEIKRNSAGNLRVIGRYNGDLVLRNDRLKGIYFLYWLVDNQWILVDTNLTSDRQRFASTLRKKYESAVLPPAEMLTRLEATFKRLYPSQGIHEMVSAESKSAKPSKSD